MLEACWHYRVQFMDDVMFMHSRRLERLRAVLNDAGSVGEVRRMVSAFSFPGSPDFFADNIRVHSELEPLGCLGDLGWYCIRLFLWIMNWQIPVQVSGRLLSERGRPGSPANVPVEFSGELFFADGVTASFYCSFLAAHQQWANIGGTRGYVEIPDFVLPFAGNELNFDIRKADFKVNGCDFRIEPQRRRIAVAEPSHGHRTAQETNCFRNFAEQVLSGRLNQEWPEAALKTQIVTCACLNSVRAEGRTIRLP